MTDEYRTLLAFDFGTKRIGVAVGQAVTRTATPAGTVSVSHGRPDWAEIEKLLDTWRPDALVVGIPLNMDGSAVEITAAAERFGNQLAGRYHLAVYRVDERLSTVEAKSLTGVSGQLARKHRALEPRELDPLAAKLILQTWFSQQPPPEQPADRPTGATLDKRP